MHESLKSILKSVNKYTPWGIQRSFNEAVREATRKDVREKLYESEDELNQYAEDLFLETYWSVPNLKRPSEILISNKGIEIAHPGAIPKILGALERLYQNERLENLIEIKKAIESDDVQGCAATILEDEYGKGLRKAVPKRFSF